MSNFIADFTHTIAGFLAYSVNNRQQLFSLILDHIQLTFTALLFSILIGLPLGILIASRKVLDKPVLGFANVMQAVPSLAALGLLVPIIGIGSPPAILMVVLYSLLPILKNTYTGIKNINEQTVEAAMGIGMTRLQVLVQVKLPIAMPVIMSGIRISAVTSVGLMTIAAYIGAGGLGNFVISGIQTSNVYLMLSGAIPACILALLMDYVVSRLERAFTPISLSIPSAELTQVRIAKEKRRQRSIMLLSATVALVFIVTLVASFLPKDRDNTVVVSSKPEVECVIMGNILSILIEENTDLTVERKLGLGSTKIVFDAISNGEVDIYPEYSGSIYGGIYGLTAQPGTTPDQLMETVRTMLAEEGLTFMNMYGFNNRYALGVRRDTAEQYNLRTISDLAACGQNFVLACSQEFPHRADGLPALQAIYPDLSFEKHLQFSGALMYDALINNQVDVMNPFTTDALLEKYDILVLEDDKSALSNYNMASLVRTDTAQQHPELLEVLQPLEGLISDAKMISMNYDVVVNQRTHEEVAREFLVENGLIP